MSYDMSKHDFSNPNPWMALELDTSSFFEQSAKQALLRNNASWSRRAILPIIRPTARLFIALIKLIRIFIPNSFTSPSVLHATICWGLKYFVSRDANFLILRHFNLGSQVLAFLNDNLAEGKLKAHPLRPKNIQDLRDNVFVQHDLNIYNFIIQLNTYLRENGRTISPVDLANINFSSIGELDTQIESLPNKWHNFLDLQSAIEFYTPLYALFLSDNDFWRASNSLQLDETMASYVAKLFDREIIMSLVNNKHPMVPLSILGAGFRLMLHGLDAESLYGFILYMHGKNQAMHPVRV